MSGLWLADIIPATQPWDGRAAVYKVSRGENLKLLKTDVYNPSLQGPESLLMIGQSHSTKASDWLKWFRHFLYNNKFLAIPYFNFFMRNKENVAPICELRGGDTTQKTERDRMFPGISDDLLMKSFVLIFSLSIFKRRYLTLFSFDSVLFRLFKNHKVFMTITTSGQLVREI